MVTLPLSTLCPPPCAFVVHFPQTRLLFAFNSPQWIFKEQQILHESTSLWVPSPGHRLLCLLPDGPSSLATDARCQFYPFSRFHGDLSSWSHTCRFIWLPDLSALSQQPLPVGFTEKMMNHLEQSLRVALNQCILTVSSVIGSFNQRASEQLSEFMLCRSMLENASSLEVALPRLLPHSTDKSAYAFLIYLHAAWRHHRICVRGRDVKCI